MKTFKFIAILVVFFFGFHALSAQCVEGNCYNGKGAYLVGSEGIYVGYFEGGEVSGKGIFLHENGIKLYSFFKNGLPDGKSTFLLPNGNKLFCSFVDGLLHGESKMVDSNGLELGLIIWKRGEISDMIIFDYNQKPQPNASVRHL